MTPARFDALLPLLGRLSLDTVQIARAVLVDGQTKAEVAKAAGVTRQRVGQAVQRVEAAADTAPEGWEKVELWLPPELARHVEQLAIEARAQRTPIERTD
jgi:hypothetical protein